MRDRTVSVHRQFWWSIPEGGQDAVLSGVLGTGLGAGQPQDMS